MLFSLLARAILDTRVAVAEKNVREAGLEFVHCQVLEKLVILDLQESFRLINRSHFLTFDFLTISPISK